MDNTFLVLPGFTIDIVVSNEKDAASVNGQTYNTLAEALSNATDGSTVKLLKDVGTDDVLNIDKNITLDGNHHKVTANLKSKIDVSSTTAGVAAVTISSGSDASKTVNVTLKDLTLACSESTSSDNRTYGITYGTSSDRGTLNLEMDNVTVSGFGYKGVYICNSNGNVSPVGDVKIVGCTFVNAASLEDPVTVDATSAGKSKATIMGGDHALQIDLRTVTGTANIQIIDTVFNGNNGCLSDICITDGSESDKSSNAISQLTIEGCTFTDSVGSLGNISIGSTPKSGDSRLWMQDFPVSITVSGETVVSYRGSTPLSDTGNDNQVIIDNVKKGLDFSPVKITLQNGAVLTATSDAPNSISVVYDGYGSVVGEKEGITVTGGPVKSGETYYESLQAAASQLDPYSNSVIALTSDIDEESLTFQNGLSLVLDQDRTISLKSMTFDTYGLSVAKVEGTEGTPTLTIDAKDLYTTLLTTSVDSDSSIKVPISVDGVNLVITNKSLGNGTTEAKGASLINTNGHQGLVFTIKNAELTIESANSKVSTVQTGTSGNTVFELTNSTLNYNAGSLQCAYFNLSNSKLVADQLDGTSIAGYFDLSGSTVTADRIAIYSASLRSSEVDGKTVYSSVSADATQIYGNNNGTVPTGFSLYRPTLCQIDIGEGCIFNAGTISYLAGSGNVTFTGSGTVNGSYDSSKMTVVVNGVVDNLKDTKATE